MSRTILPDYNPNEYLDNLMCTILNCKYTLAECLKRERPWLKSKRNSIGFNAAREKDDVDKLVTIGLVTTSEVVKLD